ncbi:MAG TPA: hypothetical protein ACFCUY_15215 [Xenococcaceae cyanobacterium]|jgi:hypothetical protein
MSQSLNQRLEKYTIKHREEVLMVEVETLAGEPDTILIYNGFSSSLVRATTYDPDIAIIEPGAKIISIDRLSSPYDPAQPTYIQQGLTLAEMEQLLTERGG